VGLTKIVGGVSCRHIPDSSSYSVCILSYLCSYIIPYAVSRLQLLSHVQPHPHVGLMALLAHTLYILEPRLSGWGMKAILA